MDFKSEEIKLMKDDIVLCYTDGVPEATNSEFNFFGDDELLVSAARDLKAKPDAIVKNILDDLSKFVNGADQSDDITCGIIKVH